MGARKIQLAGGIRRVFTRHSQVDVVVKYIQNQEEHHRKKTFKQEYVEMLKKFAVEYDAKYLFKWIEDEKD
jgi:ribosomal protein L13E